MVKEYMVGMGTRGGNTIEISDALSKAKDEDEVKKLKRQRELDEAEHEAELAKQQQKKRDAQGTGSSTAGVQVTGKIDVNENQRKAEEAAERAESFLATENERLRKEAKEKEEALRIKEKELAEATLKGIVDGFTAQMQTLTKTIQDVADGKAKETTAFDQLEQAEKLAERMGLSRSGGVVGTDPSVMIQLKKMDLDNARAEREHKERMKIEDRDYERQKNRDAQEIALQAEEVANKKRQTDLFAKTPELIGRAFASGINAGGGKGGGQTVEGPSHVEANVNEDGEFNCPTKDCGQVVAIGPTATHAVCAGCGLKLKVKRVGRAKEVEAEEDGEE